MRTRPLIGSKAWFGPRRFGWGLGPISAEGWAVTGLFVAAHFMAKRRGTNRTTMWAWAGLFLAVAVLKGTSPGGPAARRALVEAAGEGGQGAPAR